jgi:hypothetical protein
MGRQKRKGLLKGNWRGLGCHPEEGECHVYAGSRRKWSGPAEHE